MKEEVQGLWRTERPDLVKLLNSEKHNCQQLRHMLTSGAFPGMDTGDPDLYKAFCWRFFNLLRENGRMGVVLPRSAFSALGSAPFRKELYRSSTFTDMTFGKNTGGWIFDEVTPQYSVSLVSLQKTFLLKIQ